ncbi:hypothetical protein JAAARDRAFT_602778 [Jaapia argillacea MUCL 33604]|uniref:Major facilitator superfamily (MFS) profile domain-containing protein n=1 Tax=Jaapia argillacea MUCL 33604 TaxID=933084 RepID=A0A067PZS3_9AGAM|nr:hypothetical protein JAAARDRAFT_602778 [Jaapia argillacea MUCL 33604]
MADSTEHHLKTVDSDPEKQSQSQYEATNGSDLDLLAIYEERAGRLVVDPEEARVEFGDRVASKLKLTADGTKVLWPQPSDDPEDPQNWSDYRKSVQLFIVTLAAIVPDFDSGVGIASIFALAEQYDTTTGVINNMTSNWSIFLLGWGGIAAVILMRRYGRLPILFWSQVLALAFLVGCTFAPNLKTFTAMRCLTAFFGTCPQVTGLYLVTDMYPFHLQARKLNLWTMGFIISPFLSPFAFGFLVARANWRWAYGTASIYGAIVVAAITFFGEETMYDRSIKPVPKPSTTGFRRRIDTLLGFTGLELAKYRPTLTSGVFSHLNVLWRPQILGILIFEAMLFGFSIGINVTNAVFLGTPAPVGFGFSEFAVAGMYGTPIVSVIIGELLGRYANEWIQNHSIKKNHGVFEAESRLWACYIAVPLYAAGCILLGAAFQNKMSVGAIVMGWGLAEVATMVNTVAVYAYCNDCFPKNHGEISSLINLCRVLGGFSVAYFQVPWAVKHGALQVFGCEAAIVVGLFLLVVPTLQLFGRQLRERFSIHK